jgi:hypothetical protein
MGGKAAGPRPSVTNAQVANASALSQIAETQAGEGAQLFGTSFPGFQSAEQFYGALSTGSPAAIATAIAPAAQQISQAASSAKQNILQNAPPGGEKNLALENVDVSQGAQIGNVASQGYLGSFNALASLAGQGISQGTAAAGTGISGLGTANTGLSNLASQQLETQQLQAQEKAGAFGGIAGLAESGAELGLMAAA